MLLFSHLPYTAQPVYQLCALIRHGLFWVLGLNAFLQSQIPSLWRVYSVQICSRQPPFLLLGNRLFGNLSFGFRHGIHHKNWPFLSRCDDHQITRTGTAPLHVSVCRPTRTNHSVRFRDDDPTDLASGSIPISTTKQDITTAHNPTIGLCWFFVGLPACRSINHRTLAPGS
jgi:hypothetical protein